MPSSDRLAKLRKRLPMVTDQKHARRIVDSFRDEDKPLAIEILRGILPESEETHEEVNG